MVVPELRSGKPMRIQTQRTMAKENRGDEKTSRIRKQANEYAQSTSIHGIKYIWERGRSTPERFLWIGLCVTSALLGAWLIAPIFNKWQNSPTITTVENTNYPVWNIYFPAVTICSNNKVTKFGFRRAMKKKPWIDLANHTLFTQNGTLSHKEAQRSINYAVESVLKRVIYLDGGFDVMDEQSSQEDYIYKNLIDEVPKLLKQTMQSCRSLAILCLWQGQVKNCSDLFDIRQTDNGFCCSFNTIDMAEQFADPEDLDFQTDDFLGYGDDDDADDLDEANTEDEVDEDDDEDDDYYYYHYSGDEGLAIGSSSIGNGDAPSTEPMNLNPTTPSTENDLNEDSSTNTSEETTTIQASEQEPMDTTAEDGDEATDPPEERRRKRSTNATTTNNSNSSSVPKKAAKKLRRSNSASTLMGLSVVLNPQQSQYFIQKENFIGYRVLVHSPYSFAEVAGKGFAVGQEREVFIGVGAQLTESTAKVRRMSIQTRQCIQHDENLAGTGIKIETFSNYSRPSCLLECRAKILFKKCRCLPYYFPNFAKPWKRKTDCDLKGLQCIANSTSTLSALSVDANSQSNDDLLEGANCYCPTDCTETVYTQEMSQAQLMNPSRVHELVQNEYSVAKKLKQLSQNETLSHEMRNVFSRRLDSLLKDVTFVHIYFKELGIVKYSRDELYSIMDVIAAFGGIVGLCMGFSLLSGAELIYFFTLRMFIDRQKETRGRHHQWQKNGSSNILPHEQF